MLTRRVMLPLAALAALATVPVSAAVVPAVGSTVVTPGPASRGDDSGDSDKPSSKNKEEVKNCPTEKWTIPIELKGLACVLLLPKPEPSGEGNGGLTDPLG